MLKILKFNKKMAFGSLDSYFSVLLLLQLMFLIKEWKIKKEVKKNSF